jgi:allophanate hydrolase
LRIEMGLGSGDSLDLITVAAGYAEGRWTVGEVMAEVRRRIAAYADPAVWIDRLGESEIAAQIAAVESARGAGKKLPLYGIPFAVKDNIDMAGRPTTAACPEFAYTPGKSATIVRKLCEAGAILVGKTNLDQFATGLVGVRSPYGECRNVFDGKYISGGSSSGSAVAVAAGLVSFALGTDTAGSGRVPAAFGNIVGYKPTRGLLSCAGVVPACQSLDCVSIFALTCGDAAAVGDVARGFDAGDPYSRSASEIGAGALPTAAFRFGVPREDQLEFFGNREFAAIYQSSVKRLASVGGQAVVIDFEPFLQAGALLYQGPWVAERVAGLRDFLRGHPSAVLPVISTILAGAAKFSAADAFAGAHRLAELCQVAKGQWEAMDLMLLPTTGTIYTREEIAADPIQLNKNMGYYTQFVNLMDLCGVAVPAGFTAGGLPVGVTVIARAGRDQSLLYIADRFHRETPVKLGATGAVFPMAKEIVVENRGVLLAVVGAHLSGQPLNWQLTQRNARLVRACRTAGCYRFHALPGTVPAKPGLVRVGENAGASIEIEIWELSHEAFGSFVAEVPPPLAIGSVKIEDGTFVKGFLCEPFALEGAEEITQFGGWRAYLKSKAAVAK